MKRVFALVLCLALLLSFGLSFAEEDVMDLSADENKVNEYGIPTAEFVTGLKEIADQLWDAQNYQEAAEAYSTLAVQANWLANIIASVDEPFYSASSDDRNGFFKNNMKDLAGWTETTANTYKSTRNQAMAREGMCYYYLKDYSRAVPYLMKALDLIEINDESNWQMCAEALLDIVGLKDKYAEYSAEKEAVAAAAKAAEEEAAAAAKAAEEEAAARAAILEELKKEMENKKAELEDFMFEKMVQADNMLINIENFAATMSESDEDKATLAAMESELEMYMNSMHEEAAALDAEIAEIEKQIKDLE